MTALQRPHWTLPVTGFLLAGFLLAGLLILASGCGTPGGDPGRARQPSEVAPPSEPPPAAPAAIRAPAVPLITHDPYLSCWSFTDELYADWPKHWTGAVHGMCGLVRVDGKPMKFMGGYPGVETVKQTSVLVLPTRTVYTFAAGPVELVVTFLSPLVMDDMEMMSRPASYVQFAARSTDGKKHDVQIYFDMSAEWAVHEAKQSVQWGRVTVDGLQAMKIGTVDQKVLGRKGDSVRIDWGHALLAVPDGPGVKTVIAADKAARDGFLADGKLPAKDDDKSPRPANQDWPVMAATIDLGAVAAEKDAPAATHHLIVAYDDEYSVELFGRQLRPWWRRMPGSTTEKMLEAASEEWAKAQAHCGYTDEQIIGDALKSGGPKYAALLSISYRQAIAAHKLVAMPREPMKDAQGNPLPFLDGESFTPLFLSKENFSNGSIGTVDVTYPSAPLFLLYNPALLNGFNFEKGGGLVSSTIAKAASGPSLSRPTTWAPIRSPTARPIPRTCRSKSAAT